MAPPFPTVPVTVDIIIEVNSREIVLIERRDTPHGFAFPGGFVEPGESLAEAAKREAKEETGIDIHLSEQFFAYSKPGRDPRGPVVSVVFIAEGYAGALKAGDDAKAARLYDITNGLPYPAMCFDHQEILSDYLTYRKTRGTRPVANR